MKIISFEEAKKLKDRYKDKKLVQAHGVFDVLHAGHLKYFESAKAFGDLLVVTLTADQFVNKGPGRPYFKSNVRANMIAGLEVVDFVVISQFPTAVPTIEAIRPNYYVKGRDYKDMDKDVTGAIYDEKKAVMKNGGELVFTDDEMYSSSSLINQFFQDRTEDQTKIIESIQKLGGYERVESVLEDCSKLKICLAGEPIVDTYVFCDPEALSSKSPSISAKFLYEESYAGGTLAIANHLADFAQEVCMVTTHGGEEYFRALLDKKLDPRVSLKATELTSVPTPRKTRYIAAYKSERIFELTQLTADQWMHHDPKPFIDELAREQKNRDLTILADFGHGLFEGEALDSVSQLNGTIALNVQTNSSNYGFNPFTKHRLFDYLCIDTKEARIAYHDRFSSTMDLARQIRNDLTPKGASLSLTLGSYGAYFFPVDSSENYSPTFVESAVDPIGAGDAYFGLTSMLIKVGCPEPLVPFLGNIFAGLKARVIGHKRSVTKGQLLKTVASILK